MYNRKQNGINGSQRMNRPGISHKISVLEIFLEAYDCWSLYRDIEWWSKCHFKGEMTLNVQ